MRAAVLTAAALVLAGSVMRGADETGVLKRLDHLVYAVPDLDGGVADLEQRLGVHAALGGPHPGRGTRNALIALGPESYLEIIAPDPAQPVPAGGRWFGVDPKGPAHLAGWAAKGGDLNRVVAAAARRGVTLGEVMPGARTRPDGVELRWTLTNPDARAVFGLAPFFIDWGTSPHPAATAPRGPEIVALRAEHPRPDLVREPLAALGLDLPVDAGPRPALVATLRIVSGLVELR